MPIELVMTSSHLILCWPLLLLPPMPPSIRIFSNESILRMRWPKYWSFRFSISLSNQHTGLISFRMDWLDLLAVQGTLKSLLQHHSSKASILQCSVFFTVQLSHPYMTTGKTIALTRRKFVGKEISLLSSFLIVFLSFPSPSAFYSCLFFSVFLLSSLSSISQITIDNYVPGGFPRWPSDKESACQWRRHRKCEFSHWAWKIPWRRKWQLTPVFLPGKSHRWRRLVGYSPWGLKE